MGLRSSIPAAVLLLTPLAASAADPHDEAWVNDRVEKLRPPADPGWRKVLWAPSLGEARTQSGKEMRPVFLFSHDGNLDTGRC